MNNAIGFFFFNRLDTTKIVLEQIRIAKPGRLYLISDGARVDHVGEKEIVEEIREYVAEHIDWDCKVTKNYSECNMGCKERMASGISWLLSNEDSAIILEDDCRPEQSFFLFADEMLERYRDDERVMMVSGSMLTSNSAIRQSYTFSKYATIWGWATWKRAWDKYDIQISDWRDVKEKGLLRKDYTILGYRKAVKEFDSVYNNAIDTWDYQWTYTILKNNGLNIVPSVNMIENIGFGRDDATHTKGETDIAFDTSEIHFPLDHPSKVEEDIKYDRLYQKERWGIKVFLKNKMHRVLNKLKGSLK